MSERVFRECIERQWDAGKFLCIGLDPDEKKLPQSVKGDAPCVRMLNFNKEIIDATAATAGFYKPNSAFYEAYDADGWNLLKATIAYIRERAPAAPVILDAKRGDIGNTNMGYAASAFDALGADAITVHPYLGSEALAPFLARIEKGIFVLCRTSNPGSGEFQGLGLGGEPLYMHVARAVAQRWNTNGNCALVVGATYPDELRAVRAVADDIPILIPGVGAQGGDVEESVAAGADVRRRGVLLSVSRDILYASSGEDFADAARAKAVEYDGRIRAALLQ
ncbi:orotidine-5'-phosphate decarboxylase [Candidatus Kaiserbacteria bacterium CG10_big_fil_rev_8_21_14_0_10_59_10]|uniref:Orotidine 5'-phosphate decarboxylase n=1 Tax=Candidatus Kaiserbacteria bacterium CG10_big_fil_rev_8_21_14_0_10_59_10 TaxID=1974612 RepID=A0A2H0UAD1_9BACT|nr:MAG: orotidine-5'-phosphate decarboxylase [Candidatus Kaiserbacteria bacterium CG10_big_fil_rev_8_21_14_0_10_59_10]